MHGRCLCGQIGFEVLRPVRRVYQCHCSQCRRQGGSASNTATLVAVEHFRWLLGEGSIASWRDESGFRSDFCSRCGSPVPNPLRDQPYVWVPMGLCDGAGAAEIVAHLCVDSSAGWDRIAARGQHYATMPPLPELLTLLEAVPAG